MQYMSIPAMLISVSRDLVDKFKILQHAVKLYCLPLYSTHTHALSARCSCHSMALLSARPTMQLGLNCLHHMHQ